MATNLDRFVSGAITRRSRTAVRPDFSMAMILAYLPPTIFAGLRKTYEEPSDLLADLVAAGLSATAAAKHAAYVSARSLCLQSPRVPQFKVGKRALAPTQLMRLTPPTPAAADVLSVTIDGITFEVTADGTPTVAELCTALAGVINVDPDAILASGGASAAAPQTLDITDFNGVIGAGTIVSPGRNFTFAINTHADWDATSIIITGKALSGRIQTESVAIPNGGSASPLVGTKVFDMSPEALAETTILIPTQSGTNGTLTIGVGEKFDDDGYLAIGATDGTTHVDIAADTAGGWYRYSDFSDGLSLEDRSTDPGIATDLAALRNADAAWHTLHLADGQSSAQILAAAAWAELELVQMQVDTVNTAEADSDVASIALSLKDLGYMRTKCWHSRKNHGRAMAIGAVSSLLASPDPNERFPSLDYKPIIGCEADDFDAEQINRLAGTTANPTDGNGSGIYIEAIPAGTNVGTSIIWGSLVAGGEWIDVVYAQDWSRSDIQITEFEFFLNRARPPFTRETIAALEDVVESRLNVHSGAPYNIYVAGSITIRSKAYEDTTPAERQTRRFNGVKWGATGQGAIRAIDVSGEVTP